MKLYADLGFQIPQDIPGDVSEAYQALVAAGYDKRLVRVSLLKSEGQTSVDLRV